jgi:UDP-N-acetylglucosamine 2-epimerase (non-hydrolysing)
MATLAAMPVPKRLMTIFGTRPEAIKMAPIILALRDTTSFEPITVVTGQHREMLDQVTTLFDIPPDYDLDIQQERHTLTDITTRTLDGLAPLIIGLKPDLVVVQGDTSTTFAAALAAFYQSVPVAHVEAGLRTGNRLSPFPEEINRRLTTQLASLHLAPTLSSVANLRADGIPNSSIVCTGNTVIDALAHTILVNAGYDDPALKGLDQDPRRVILATVHRRESWGEQMEAVGRAFARLASRDPSLLIVIPLHRNPIVRGAIMPAVEGLNNILVVDPLPYGSFARLIDRSDLIITDSGGIQEEAPSRGKPVLVLRDVTERPEAVAAGTVELVGTDEDRIVSRARALLADPAEYRRMSRAINPYGDGQAAKRSIEAIAWFFGLAPRPVDFSAELTTGGTTEATAHQD